MRLKPTSGALGNLGTTLFRRQRYAEAARAMEKAVALSDSDSRIWRSLVAAYYWAPGERDRATYAYDRAATLLEKGRGVNPRDAWMVIRLADCYAMTGRDAEARAAARQALLLAPQDTKVLFMAGEIFEHLGDRSRAVELIADALAKGAPWADVETSLALEATLDESCQSRLPVRSSDSRWPGALVTPLVTRRRCRPRRAPAASRPCLDRRWSAASRTARRSSVVRHGP